MAAFFGLLGIALTARALEPVEFGMLMMVVSFAGVVIRLCGLESWQALIKFGADRRAEDPAADISDLLRFGIFLDVFGCLLAAGVLFGLAQAFGAWLGWRPEVVEGTQAFAIAALLSLTSTPTAVLRMYNRFDLVAQHRVAAALAKLLVIGFTCYFDPTFNGLLLGWVLGQILHDVSLAVVGGTQLHRNGQRLFGANSPFFARVDSAVWRFVLKSNLDSVVRAVRELDVQLVALLLNEVAAGMWRLGRQIALVVGILVNAVLEAIYPQIAQLTSAKRWDLLPRFIFQTGGAVAGVVVVVLLGFLLIGAPLITWVFGQAYQPVYALTAILIFSYVLVALIQAIWSTLLALGAQWHMVFNQLVATVIYAALLVSLTLKFGLIGAGWAVAGLYLVWGALSFRSFRQVVPTPSSVRRE